MAEMWREANRPVKTFLGLNPLLLLILFGVLFYPRWWTLGLALFLTGFFALVEYQGLPALMALRWLRAKLTGNYKRSR